MIDAIRERKLPLVGAAAGCGRSSTSRTPPRPPSTRSRAARPGIYNVVDDEPATVREWLPAAAAAVGPPPRRLPRWLARLLAGEAATVMMTEAVGASNAKAKRELGWPPRHATGASASPRA